MIIKIYSDSLAFPRFEEKTFYDETYAGKLASHKNFDVHLRGRSGFRSSEMTSMSNMDARFSRESEPEIAILQFGVVDCAPRPIPRALRYLVSLLYESLRSKVIKLIHFLRPYTQQVIFFRHTSPKRFQKNYMKLVQEQLQYNVQVICLSIMDPPDDAEKQSPGLKKSVRQYNNIIHDICKKCDIAFIDISHEKEFLLKDGIHISNKGHEEIYKILQGIL